MVEILETNRLQLRKITVADSAEVFENWASSEVVAKYLTWAPHSSVEVTKEYLTFEEQNRSEGWGSFPNKTNQLTGK